MGYTTTATLIYGAKLPEYNPDYDDDITIGGCTLRQVSHGDSRCGDEDWFIALKRIGSASDNGGFKQITEVDLFFAPDDVERIRDVMQQHFPEAGEMGLYLIMQTS